MAFKTSSVAHTLEVLSPTEYKVVGSVFVDDIYVTDYIQYIHVDSSSPKAREDIAWNAQSSTEGS